MKPPDAAVNEIDEVTEEVELEDELMIMRIDEPENYTQAVKQKEWKLAMKIEIDSIEKNGSWRLTELPKGHMVISLKWIYKLKSDVEGMIVRHKTILVARDFVQKRGVDYEESFAPVTRLGNIASSSSS